MDETSIKQHTQKRSRCFVLLFSFLSKTNVRKNESALNMTEASDIQNWLVLVMDTETNACSRYFAEIVQISVVALLLTLPSARKSLQFQSLSAFTSFVRPKRPCQPLALAAHGISEAELEKADAFGVVFERLQSFCSSVRDRIARVDRVVLVAHNLLNFDLCILFLECQRHHCDLFALRITHVLDTLSWARTQARSRGWSRLNLGALYEALLSKSVISLISLLDCLPW